LPRKCACEPAARSISASRRTSDAGDGSLIALFSDQIEVAGERGRAFSDAGDSGALIVDLKGRPRALLFSGGLDESTGQDLTWANRIEVALGKLGVTLVV
jgi:hypothetical protein